MGVTIHYPPQPVADARGSEGASVFLAGTIDMGASRDWQQAVADALDGLCVDVDIFNPRRTDWDASWRQDIASPEFHGQVSWELDHLSAAQVVAVNFERGSQSPITLLELGLLAGDPARDRASIIVCCPPGFWRRGNVQIVCERFGIACVDTLEALIDGVIARLAPAGSSSVMGASSAA